MKKILIIGAGIEQVLAIQMARSMGHTVITSDMNMSAPGIRHADRAYEASTTDIEKNLEIAIKERVDGVMTICSETAVQTVAKVAETLGLHSFSMDTALKATNKAAMREALREKCVPVSPYRIARSSDEMWEYIRETAPPWVLKPVDSSGQRGTYIIQNEVQLEAAFRSSLSFSNAKAVLVDKFIRGPEVHVTMQVINKEVHFLALSDRVTLGEKYFGIAVRHIGASILPKETEQAIKAACKSSVEAIGLEDGVATCELITNDGKPVLMEIAVRVPGGYLRDVAMHLSGVDIVQTTIRNCLGEQMDFESIRTKPVYNAVSVMFLTRLNLPSTIQEISSIENQYPLTENVKLCQFHHTPPFSVPELSSSVGRFGVIVAVGDSRDEAIRQTEDQFNQILINGERLKMYSEG